MKSNLFFRRLLLLWVFAFSTTLWGQTIVTHTFKATSGTIDPNISYTTEKNGASTAPAINGSELRLYYGSGGNGGSLTLIPNNGAAITDVKFNTTTSYTPIAKFNIDGGVDTNATLSGTQYTIASVMASTSLKIRNANTSNTQLRITSIEITYALPVTGPEITVTPSSLVGFTYVEGSGPSDSQSFSVTGANLTNDITVSAPANYEVSTISGSGYSSSVTLSSTGGDVYARMIAGLAVNDYSGNIVLSSVGATDVNVAVSGNVTPIPSIPVVDDGEPTGKVGETFSFQVIASNDPTNYFVSSEILPVGLSLDGNSGLVTGTPTQAGEFITGIKATNVAGTSAEGTFIFTISKGTQTVILPDVNAYLGGDTIILPETTDKGFPIEYVSDDETVASVSGNILTIVGLGSTEIFAGNDGDSNYNLFTDSFSVVVTEAPAVPCFVEDFDTITAGNNTSTSGSSSAWTGNESFPTIVTGYQAGGALRLGSGSNIGSITSKMLLAIGGDVQVKLDVKGWTTVEGAIKVTLGAQSQTLAYTTTIAESFETKTLDFSNVPVGSTLKIETTSKRAFIDNVNVSCGTAATVWDGNDWSNGLPDATKDAIIAGTYNKSEGITAKTITVNAGISWIVNTFANVENVINNGEIIVANYANFVQSGSFTPAATGSSFKVSRATKPVVRLDYNSWSSPMKISTQKLTEFSPGTLPTRFLTYSDGTFSAITSPELTTFTPGAGYLIRTSNTYTTIPTPFQGVFEGTEPNSGDVSYVPAAVVGQYVFLGNPYPSAISMADFKTANSQLTTTTFYIWNSESKMNTENKYENAYITHSETGSVPPGIPAFIPVGQGFIVDRGSNTGNIYFNNNMRRLVDTGTFAKGPVTDKFWLQMVTPNGVKPQMLIGFSTNGTSDYDAGYDAKIFDNSVDALYSTLNEKSLVINTLGNFNSSDEVNVTANTTAAGNYTISIAQKEGVFTNGQVIYLKDNVTGTETELTAGAYTFTSNEGVQADRFTVTFSKGSLASGNVIKSQSTIYANNQMVYVKATSKIGTVDVYDMSGKLMKTTKNVNADNVSLPVTYKGIAVVKLLLENGEVVTKKIILK